MVEPIDAQNMLSRTPLVEKAAVARKEQAIQLNQPATQIEKEKHHEQDKVGTKHDLQHVEDEKRNQSGAKSQHQTEQQESEEAPEIELVREAAEIPEHKLDVTI